MPPAHPPTQWRDALPRVRGGRASAPDAVIDCEPPQWRDALPRVRERRLTPVVLASAILFSLVFAAPFLRAETDPAPAPAPVLLPERISLDGPEARQHLLVLGREDGQFRGQIEAIRYTTNDPAVVEVIDGIAVPRGNGEATLTAETEHGPSRAEVKVSGFKKDFAWSFSKHVLPVLSKQGCNAGACHGALAGKGGFRLSLRGYDPPRDFHTIAREMGGRRVELADPARSLFLTKPTMATPHKGGKKIDPDSRNYRVLSQWIASGAEPPSEKEPALERIEVLPEQSLLAPGDRSRILVTAHYADGSSQDVTQWAQFTSTDATVASVDEDGRVEVVGHGEGAVTAWFSSRVVLARITSPFPNDIPSDRFTEVERRNFIDDLVLEQLEKLNLAPSPLADDAEFLRRAHLDTIGVPPTAEETRAFLADESPGKRDRLVDDLLAREEYVDYWAYRWSDVFLVNGRLLRPDSVEAYYNWIRRGVEKNTPWDEMARQVVTAVGSSKENGATNFYGVHQDPETMAENISQTFLGISLNCAKCHNHPLEKWTNDQYYSFANFFARVRGKGWGGDARNGDGQRVLYVEPRGDLMQPRTGKPQVPAPLDGEPIDPDAPEDRRGALAEWLTAPDNDFFARTATNRIWAAYFGKGIVNPVDDMRASNPASNEPLLAALSNYLVEQDYDLKALMRLILRSATYQRGSAVLPENEADTRFFSRYYPRRHMGEVLHDAIVQVTGTPSAFDKIDLTGGGTQETKLYEEGTRALELYDSAVQSYFLSTFGRNERAIVCECERSNQPSMVQVLHLANGDTVNEKLRQKGSVVDELLEERKAPADLVEEAYLRCLSRPPTDREREGFAEMLSKASGKEKRVVVEDLFWALMTSREFLFQH